MFSLLKKTSKRLGYAIVAEIFVPFEFPRGSGYQERRNFVAKVPCV